MSFEQFFDAPQFDTDAQRQRLVSNLDMLKTMSVEEQTLYKKHYEVNHEYLWAANKASVLKAQIWRPTDIMNKTQTIAELEALRPTWKIVNSDNKKLGEDWLLYRVFCSSFNYDQNPGRLVKLLLIDEPTGKILGISSLASDVVSITCRDKWIGWDRDLKVKVGKLNHTAIGSTIVATQPFGYNFLGGKLVASMLTIKQIRDLWFNLYGDTLAGLTTTSLYGSHSMYQRIPYWREMGKTKGKIGIKPDNDIYQVWHDYIRDKYPTEYLKATTGTNGDGPATGIKQRILDMIFKELNIVKNQYIHGFERGVYFAPLYENTREFLTNKIDDSQLILSHKLKDDVEGVLDWWRAKAITRYCNLYDANRLDADILFYNRIMGQPWDAVKKLYIDEVGR
jgi:hypothetical protein